MKRFIIFLIFSFLNSADSSCPKGGYNNSQPQFGPRCIYRCHCVDDVQCDYITGNCSKGCAAGWMGPGCQFGDIAYNKRVKQLLYGSNVFINGRNATDGLQTSCVGPATWLEIDLSATYRISGLVINSSDTMNLTGYEVKVGNYSSNPPSDIVDTCFKQTITHQLDSSTDVVCTTEIVGRYLLIRTSDNANTMTVCDVRVYGGRSLAYGHNGSQSTTLTTYVANASRALDGNTNTSFPSSSCTHTLEEISPWWRVNMAVVYNIARIVLYGRSDCCTERLAGFSVLFATNSSFNLVFKYPNETPPLITEVLTLSENNAQHVEISLKNITQALTLCEVFVFGDCQYNMCGWTCDVYCYCEGPIAKQNIIHANCPRGCKTGWWGYSCNNTCDSDCKGNKCNQTDGYCLECYQGKWGHFCDKNCINCLHGTRCGASDGVCSVGCLAGLFGVSCGEQCGQCAVDGSCNRYTGACIHGCQPGWQEDNCSIDSSCPKGGYNTSQPQFGPGCRYICHCVDDVQCDYSGNCPRGCAAGWMGPGCQYGDIAYNKKVQQLLYGSNLLIDGTNATDGLPTTCGGPTTLVVIDLNATYRISGLVMNSRDAVNLTGYEVRVGNYSSDPPSDNLHTCLKQTITKRFDTSTDVVCTTEIVGWYLLIRTPDNATTMTLCDVRVYGGRSLAYGHNGSQSTTLTTYLANASRALDGNTDTRFWSYSCTHTLVEMSPWWRVNLAVVHNIERIVLYGRSDPCCTERLAGFSVSFSTNSSFNLVFKYPNETPPLITEVITLSENNAQHVEISLKNISQALTLCEVFVFGDCQDNMCGWTCDICCHCEGPIAKQNIVYANCISGCKTGWWGHSCNNTCGSNCKGITCNQTNGYCLECAQGKWGRFCDNNCTNCLQGTGCGASDGICSVGCLTGYFGVSCSEHCIQCAVDGSCNRYNGSCIHGCQPGWQETNCTIGLQQEERSTESSSSLPIGIPVGGALGALGFTVMITVVAIIYWKRRKRAPETSEIEHTYDQIDSTRALHEKLSDYSKIEELGLSPVIPKENTYENTLSEKNLIPKCEFRDNYQHYISLDDKTDELRLLSVFNSIPSPASTKTKVTRTGRADDCIETLNKSYLFAAKGKKEFTILSDFPTTSEAIWRLALEHRIHLIIIIGENRIPLKPKVQIDIGLIQIECIDITVERDLLLCNINLSECEKVTKMRNVQVILSAEECSFCIPSNINETLAVLKKRLCLRQGIEAFNTLINCTPDATDGECFVASLLMTDFMERSGYIDIIGIIEAMRKEKHDAVNYFDKFKFCHDVIFKWIVDEENKGRM